MLFFRKNQITGTFWFEVNGRRLRKGVAAVFVFRVKLPHVFFLLTTAYRHSFCSSSLDQTCAECWCEKPANHTPQQQTPLLIDWLTLHPVWNTNSGAKATRVTLHYAENLPSKSLTRLFRLKEKNSDTPYFRGAAEFE